MTWRRQLKRLAVIFGVIALWILLTYAIELPFLFTK
jgi:hypothetical protein